VREHRTETTGKQGPSNEGRAPPSPAGLTREWARAIAFTSYVPMSPAEVHDYLRDLIERLVAALSSPSVDTQAGPSVDTQAGPSVDTQAASDVGARLVAAGFIGAQTLSRTFEVLGKALPPVAAGAATGKPVPPSCGRIIELLGAPAAGYTWALRNYVVDQQEEVKRALSQAWQNVERDLRASEARFREVFDSSPVGIAISEPGGLIIQTNRSLEETLGYSPGELLGRELSELFSTGDRPIVEEHYQGLATGRDSRFQVRFALRRADGEDAWVYLTASRLPDAKQAHHCLITMVDDITDLHLIEQRLHYQTLHDLQAGLPNRQYFVTHLEKVLGQLDPSAVVTLIHLDLDGFSAINDGLGHHVGERLLDVVARRLEWVVADQRAMVARLGADEYAILIEPGESVLDVGAFAEMINTELAEPFYVDGIGVAVTATIGIVQRRVAGALAEELMRAASATLRRIRGRGKRQWTLFDPEIDAANRAQLQDVAAQVGDRGIETVDGA